MSFHVGQKVVCIDGQYEDKNWRFIPDRPKKGDVCTIRGIFKATVDWGGGSQTFLLLEEHINPVENWLNFEVFEGGFWIRRFRPVVERKTDISAFTALLNPANHKVLERT